MSALYDASKFEFITPQLSHVDVMGNEEFDTLFNHYDKTGQGFIDSESALFALISDMMRRNGGEISAHELQRVRKAVLAVCDSGWHTHTELLSPIPYTQLRIGN